MEIPASVRINAGIQTGAIYYFEDGELSSPEPHFFIVLNIHPRTDDFLILACASSQEEKRKKIAQYLGFPIETLVLVSPGECPLFNKDTVIDCNRVFERNISTLVKKLEEGKLKPCTELMPDGIIKKLIAGVMISTQISKQVKEMLSDK